MGKSVAILLDGGFVTKKMEASIGQAPTADQIYGLALSCLKPGEELFRIYFYHCMPFQGHSQHPITMLPVDFSTHPTAVYNTQLFEALAAKNYVAFRKGELVFRGWKISDPATKRLQTAGTPGPATLAPADCIPDFIQKGVDIKIGLDVAWLASKHIVDKILLVSGDTDLIPAMKFARREGVQVVTAKIGQLKSIFDEHSDEIRTLTFDVTTGNWSV